MSAVDTRRRWLVGGVAAVAAALGAGWAWRRQTPDGAAEAGLWDARFATPSGASLDAAQWRGRPLLLNFWATWCPPCVKEMPQFDRFHRAHAGEGWQVVGIAIDRANLVNEFLQRTPVSYPIGLAGLEGSDLMQRLGNPHGALPFTVAFGKSGEVLQRKLGETNFDELSGWASAYRRG